MWVWRWNASLMQNPKKQPEGPPTHNIRPAPSSPLHSSDVTSRFNYVLKHFFIGIKIIINSHNLVMFVL